VEDFSTAIELNPKSAQAYFARAIALSVVHQKARAVADLERVIQLNPKFKDAHAVLPNVSSELTRM
jgi:tetratricopeptide (TPR) repeat protein